MTEWVLDAAVREARGKGGARKLRAAGKVPAIVYGLKDPVAVEVSDHAASQLIHKLHGVSRVVTLRVANGGKTQEVPVLIKDTQTTAVGNHLLHIDFNEVDVKQTVRVTVEVHPVGTAAGVVLGGTLQMVLHEILVECLPGDIPERIDADVTALGIGKSIHVKELNMPPGVRAITDPESAVIVVSGQMKEEVEVAPVVAAVEGVEGAPAAEGAAAAPAAEAKKEEPAAKEKGKG
jgi:large subunit ribosomal protein L25